MLFVILIGEGAKTPSLRSEIPTPTPSSILLCVLDDGVCVGFLLGVYTTVRPGRRVRILLPKPHTPHTRLQKIAKTCRKLLDASVATDPEISCLPTVAMVPAIYTSNTHRECCSAQTIAR